MDSVATDTSVSGGGIRLRRGDSVNGVVGDACRRELVNSS